MRTRRAAMAIGLAPLVGALSVAACSSSGEDNGVSSTRDSSTRDSSSRSTRSSSATRSSDNFTSDFTESTDSSTDTPSTEPVGSAEEEELAECEQQARHAVVTYQPTQRMTAGESSRVVVVAGVESSDSTTSTSFPGNEPTTSVKARLACTVE